MSLHDEHLQQALKYAPDYDVVPSDVVRQQVLDYAESTGKPKGVSFFKHCVKLFSDWRMTSWQLVGMGTVASVLFITVVLQGQLPDGSIWSDADVQDIAQTKVESPATVRPSQEPKLATQKEEIAEAAVSDSNSDVLELKMETEMFSRAEERQTKVKKSLADETKLTEAEPMGRKPSKQLDKELEKPVMDFEDRIDTAKTAAPIVATENVEMLEADSAAGMSRPKAAAKTKLAARKQALPSTAQASGDALAKKDIQAGIFRILVTESDWQADKPLLDDETGFQVQMVKSGGIKLSNDKLEAYNQAMRHWYRINKNSTQ